MALGHNPYACILVDRILGLTLTKREPRCTWRAQYGRSQHVHATRPGELVCVDTFYIGKMDPGPPFDTGLS